MAHSTKRRHADDGRKMAEPLTLLVDLSKQFKSTEQVVNEYILFNIDSISKNQGIFDDAALGNKVEL